MHCSPHLNLIVKDYCKLDLPATVFKQAVAVMKDIKNSSVKKGRWDTEWKKYAEEQKEEGNIVRPRGVNLPCDVRWYSYNKLLHRFSVSKTVLRRLQADDVIDFPFITSNDFWDNLAEVRVLARTITPAQLIYSLIQVQRFMYPMCECIGVAESDSSTIGDVPEIIRKARLAYESFLSYDKQDAMDTAFERMTLTKFVDSEHYAANLVHPKYRGSALSPAQRSDAYKALKTMAQQLNFASEDYSKLNLSLRSFLTKGNVLARTGPFGSGKNNSHISTDRRRVLQSYCGCKR